VARRIAASWSTSRYCSALGGADRALTAEESPCGTGQPDCRDSQSPVPPGKSPRRVDRAGRCIITTVLLGAGEGPTVIPGTRVTLTWDHTA
jgi:hypothetical protein